MGKGSSPRVRGKRHDFPVSGFASRLIPARAGKTRPLQRGRQRHGAHPRACGENLLDGDPPPPTTGSSPRVRGKHHPLRRRWTTQRLIPARAGKTCCRWRGHRRGRAHPRACGENDQDNDPLGRDRGSSPRVRGKRMGTGLLTVRLRLIPARAGKTFWLNSNVFVLGAHPRACGENRLRGRFPLADQGSSPRVRGKLVMGPRLIAVLRLIPARAGKTDGACPWRGRHWAHPRACGENAHAATNAAAPPGSSPRVRGKHQEEPDGGRRPGLIPARAGKTTPKSNNSRSATAHPRACGEN